MVVEGNRVFACHSEENLDTTTQGRVVAIDATGTGDVTGTKEIWRVDGILAGYSSPAVHGGHLYVVENGGTLLCFATADGKRLWDLNLGTVGKGSPVWADGKIYVPEVNGKFYIVEDRPEGPKVLDRKQFQSRDGTVIEIQGSPAVADGRIYLPTSNATYAIGPRQPRPAPAPAAAAAEPSPGEAGPPAALRLVPGDVVLSPGESATFRARLYDGSGRFLRETKEIALAPKGIAGKVSGASFTADLGAPFQAGIVEGKVGEVAGTARVRVVARLPLAEDFEKGKLPAGWIGLSPLKFQVTDRDGSKVLQKLSTNPKFFRADCYLGRPEWSGYTLQADVLGTKARRSLPDYGIIGCRYTFYLGRDPRTLQHIARVVGWLPMPRIQKDAPFDWKPDVWYRMKKCGWTRRGARAWSAARSGRETSPSPRSGPWRWKTRRPR